MSNKTQIPPRGFYRDGNRVAPLLALAAGKITPAAFSVWHAIAMYSWQEGRCRLTNAELGAFAHVRARQARNLLVELEEAGLLNITYHGSERWLQVTIGGAIECTPAMDCTPCNPLQPQVSKLTNSSGELATSRAAEELNLLESPDSLREGGMGGGGAPPATQCSPPSNPVQPSTTAASDLEHATLAARLRQAGVYPAPAAKRAAQMLAMHNLDTALERVAAHLRDLEREGVHDRKECAKLLQWRVVNTDPTPPEPEIVLPEPRLRVAPAQSPEALLWQRTLDELRLSIARTTFDARLHGSVGVGTNGDPHTLVVQVPNPHSIPWLTGETGLARRVQETLRRVGENEQLKAIFVVEGGTP